MKDSAAPQKSKPKRGAGPSWAALPDDELLQLRFKDLDLSVGGTWLQDCLRKLNEELKARSIVVRPHAWIAEEWFSPDNTPGIAMPFYLAHPRLMKLERKMVLDVEGGTRRECMQILRHEAGHVVQHAYSLHRRRRWQELFGRSSKAYPNYYRPNPASRDFVQHLPRWYAQSHPDEDFAETFAVWLTPRANWRKRYAEWPALEKLHYMDELMTEIAGHKPLMTNRTEVDPASRLTGTLGQHYKKKLAHYAIENESGNDRDLKRIFSTDGRRRRAPTAAAFIQRNRGAIRRLVTEWTGEEQPGLDAILDDMSDRCRVLNLRAPGDARQIRTSLSAVLTNKTMRSHYSSSRRQWFAL